MSPVYLYVMAIDEDFAGRHLTDGPMYKIGVSSTPTDRMRQVAHFASGENPFHIHLSLSIAAQVPFASRAMAHRAEKYFHRLFHAHHYEQEWYALTDAHVEILRAFEVKNIKQGVEDMLVEALSTAVATHQGKLIEYRKDCI